MNSRALRLGAVIFLNLLLLAPLAGSGAARAGVRRPVDGVLRVSPVNPRYFTDNSGRAVYLTGSHTWSNFCEIWEGRPVIFDYNGYLDWLDRHNHNFFRLFVWEHATWTTWGPDSARTRFGPPLLYPRTGPGLALDSLPKFDISRFNEAFFQRQRERVQMAQNRGIYVQVMLFEGFSNQRKGEGFRKPGYGNPWGSHPFNKANNINAVDGDANGDGEGEEIFTLHVPAVTELQKAYVRRVIDNLNDLDNYIYEICNETDSTGVEWQYAIIDLIHQYEKTKPKQHPVVMTVPWPGGKNSTLFDSPAEAIAPNPDGGRNLYRGTYPPAEGKKVIFADTDHLWGHGGNADWAWKAFTSGYNPMFMDPFVPLPQFPRDNNYPDYPDWEPLRVALGQTLMFAERMDLVAMTPHPELASSGFCLASERERLIYLGEGGALSTDLSAMPGELTAEWFSPAFGAVTDIWRVQGGGKLELRAPYEGPAVLYIHH
ncbi:DUF6298 domain-containing protein [bacterium]|nr:DUF6298 domain-containing protein [bacterium]